MTDEIDRYFKVLPIKVNKGTYISESIILLYIPCIAIQKGDGHDE